MKQIHITKQDFNLRQSCIKLESRYQIKYFEGCCCLPCPAWGSRSRTLTSPAPLRLTAVPSPSAVGGLAASLAPAQPTASPPLPVAEGFYWWCRVRRGDRYRSCWPGCWWTCSVAWASRKLRDCLQRYQTATKMFNSLGIIKFVFEILNKALLEHVDRACGRSSSQSSQLRDSLLQKKIIHFI